MSAIRFYFYLLPVFFCVASAQVPPVAAPPGAMTVTRKALDWAAAQAAMQAGQADVNDTIFKTEARQRLFDFTPPNAQTKVPIYFHHSTGGIVPIDSLKWFTVGVKDGDACADALVVRGVDRLKRCASYSAVAPAAAAGDMRVFCIDLPPAGYLLDQRGIADDFRHSQSTSQAALHRAMRKGDTALLKVVNDGFARITPVQYAPIEQVWKGSPVSGPVGNVRYVGYLLLAALLAALLLVLWNLMLRRRVLEKTRSLSASVAALSQARLISDEALAHLKATLSAIPDLLFEVDLNGKYYRVDASNPDLRVAPKAALPGQRMSDVLSADAAVVTMAALAQAQVDGHSHGMQYSLLLPQGQMWFELSVARKETPVGEVPRFIAIAHDITRRKNDQQKLEKLLAEQKAMLENDVVGIIKLANRVVQWTNPAFDALFGYSTGELVGESTRRHYATEAAYLNFAAQAYPKLAEGQVFRAQTEFVHKDGSSLWVDLSGVVLDSASGESMWVFQDMTERKRAESALEQEADRLKKFASLVPGVLYQYLLRPDGSSCFPFGRESICGIYRVSPQQVQEDASAVFARIHPDDLSGVVASIQESARNLTLWQHEYRVKFDDGTVRWLFGSSVPERLDDGAVLWHGFITDITERRAADEKLRQLSRSVEQAPIAIVITDLDGGIQYANPKFTENTGYTLEDVLGKNPRVLQSGLTKREVYVDLWQTLKGGGVWRGNLHNCKKNGDFFVEHAVIAPVHDAHGRVTHYVALKQDISSQIQADLALQTSLQEKVALLNEVHHRVKNNLQVITSLLRLEAGRTAQPDTKSVLRDMQGRIQSMALLHETLYCAGTFASIDLGAYLKQLATQAFRAQGSQSGAVRLTLEVASVNVAMDQATPCGLLVNELVSNSLKHGFPDGRTGVVLVRLQPTDTPGLWCVCVKDTGVGLPEDFEARSKQSLGLQLVSDLARQLGGHLEVGPGPGTMFCVTFAIAQPALAAPLSGVSPA